MKTLSIVNQTSGISHEITFKSRVSSSGKVVIMLDGRNVGKINRASKTVFSDRQDVYNAVSEHVDEILLNN